MGSTFLGTYKLISLGRIPSTQTYAHELIAAGRGEDGTVVMADAQTAGHGRHARQWVSNPGNLYVSFIFDARRRDSRLAYAIAVAVADTIAAWGISPQIKWPNDILIDGAKVCGILIEYVDNKVIIGIGVNIASAPTVVKYPTTWLGRYADVKRREFLARLMEKIDFWRRAAFSDVRRAWTERAVGINQTILYHDAPYKMIGLDENGALILRQGTQEIKVYGDEINI